MKKILTFALMFVAIFSLTSCKKKDVVVRTYVADGEYTAYSINEDATKPEVTIVTVTIKNDKVSAVDIDTIQGSVNTESQTAAFNEKSKKELGYGYHMHYYNGYMPEAGGNPTEEGYIAWLKTNNKLEWFEQIALVEAKIVAEGVDSITLADGEFSNVSGVTVSAYDYLDLVKEAIQMAKEGKKQSVLAREDDLVIATANVAEDGKLSNVVLDEITGSYNKTENTWSWGQAKQELGYGYHMHYYNGYMPEAGGNPTEEGYAAWLKANNKLEWVDQAALICAAWLANNNVSYETIGSVSVADHQYLETLNGLLK